MNKVQNIRYMRSAMGGEGRWSGAVARKLASNGSTLECQRSWVIHVPERRCWVGVTKTYREEFIWVEDEEGKRRLTGRCPYDDVLITSIYIYEY